MPKIITLLERVRSLHNVGSFFRTADGAGLDKIYLTGFTGYPPRKEISKVSLGAEETVPWEHSEDQIKTAKKLKKSGYKLIGIEITSTSQNIWDYTWPKEDTCLIFGNEIEGITPDLLELCDEVLHVPMFGAKQSLNVSVCAGIVFYEVVKNLKK